MAINREKVQAAAAKLLQQGKFDKAVVELQRLVEDDPTDVRTLLKLGETYPKMGKKKEAIATFEQAANIYAEQGFFLKAVAVLKQLLRVDNNLPEMHLKLAELYQQLGLASDALQHYQNVAVAYEQAGKARETLDILKRMVDLDPDNLPSRIKLGELFFAQSLESEAMTEFRSALAFLKGQQRHDDYIRVAEKVLTLDAGALDITRDLAKIYLSRKEASLALAKLQVAFKIDGRHVETLSLMAQAFLDMGQVGKTVVVYKELAKVHQADGHNAMAKAQWERVLELVDNDEEALVALGRAKPAGERPAERPVADKPPRTSEPRPIEALPRPKTGVTSGVGGESSRPKPETSATPKSKNPHEEQLQRLLTETDVYVKYGLKDKAAEHLQKVFAIQADYIPALEKQKQLLAGVGGRELKDALRRLVAAADEQAHPRLAEWKGELANTDNKRIAPTQAKFVPSSAKRESEELIVESIEGDFIRSTEGSVKDMSAEQEVSDVSDLGVVLDAEEAPAPPPRAPSTSAPMPLPLPMPVAMPLPAPPVAMPPLPPHTQNVPLAPYLPSADDLVRAALQDISEEDLAPVGGSALDPVSAPSDAVLELEQLEEELEPLPTGVQPIAASSQEMLDAAAEAALGLDDGSFDAAFAAPARTGFDEDTDAVMRKPARPTIETSPAFAPSALGDPLDLGSLGISDEAIREAATSLLAGLPVRDPSPALAPDSGPVHMPDDVRAILTKGVAPPPTQPMMPNLSRISSLPSVAASPKLPEPRSVAPIASEEDAPVANTVGKLGLAAKAHGFENDPANQFFPDELEEAEFFIQQDLLDEAKEILAAILEDVPDSDRVQWMMARIAAKESGEDEPKAPWEQRILDEVEDQLSGLDLQAAPKSEERQVSVDEVLSQFKKGIAETVPEDDAVTHYDLGCAYRDMGLLDEAIGEFNIAARAASKAADANYLIGVTYSEQGERDKAMNALSLALRVPGASSHQRAACEYQRGVLFEDAGDLTAAQRAFKAALSLGHGATDLERRIQSLVAQVGAVGSDDSLDGMLDDPQKAHAARGKNIDYL